MKKVLFADPEKCVGCMACVMACSMKQGDISGPGSSMILPVKIRRVEINVPVVCRQCAKPLCADACPMGAISRDESTKAMLVDYDLCIACGMCTVACPLGGITVNSDLGHSVKCNLCGGDPECVKVCGYGALTYISEEELGFRKKREAVNQLAKLLEKIAY
jgi:Fe-S-cluster-containing hydrogenase component 2